MEKINNKKTVPELPEEIIEKILKSNELLKAAALTCKTWNEITCKIGWKLNLNFNIKNGVDKNLWLDDVSNSNRNFNSIQFEGYREKKNIRLMNIFEKHEKNLQKLVMRDSTFLNFKIFCDVLSTMPNLKEISFYKSKAGGRFEYNFSEHLLPLLQKLETLKLVKSDFKLMKYFKKTQINSLEIVDRSGAQSLKYLLDFLAHQNNLKCLKLTSNSGMLISNLFNTPILTQNLPFKLKELVLLDIDRNETFNHYCSRNFLKFLEFHSDTIEKLGVGCTLPDLIFDFIFAKYKRLSSLTFLPRGCPRDLSLHEINPNIKILDIRYPFGDDTLKEFFKHVPNVEKLRIIESTNLHIVLSTLTRLTHLELEGKSRNLSQMKSQSLQSIKISYLDINPVWNKMDFIPNWKKIAANNPNINTMKIKKVDGNIDIVELLTKMKLQYLDLPLIKVDDKVCTALRENTQDMKSLRIHKTSFENCQENLSDVKCLRFHDDEDYDHKYTILE